MKVIKRTGLITKFSKEKIIIAITKAMNSVDELNEKLANEIADEVNEHFASHKEVSVEDIQDYVEDLLIKKGSSKLAKSYIMYRAKRAEVRELKDYLGIEDDLKFGVNAISLLDSRYLKTVDGKKETPSQMFKRVARAIASVEKNYGNNPAYWSKVFYNLMSNQYFLPNTPTLSNGGNKQLNHLFACFAFEISDSIEDIFQTVKDCAMVQKCGGGVGLHLSKLRPAGDVVKTTEGIASGPISFMRVFDVTSDVIKQGSIRRGGNLGLLLINHPDILDFIMCKNDETKFNNFNISVAITDDFMRSVKNDLDYALVNPKTNKLVKKISARNLFKIIAESAWKNGEPGIVFWDKVQADNPTPKLGCLIKNLCGEADLLPNEACCLGSINLSKFVDRDENKIIYSSLRKVVHHAVRFLDDIIDASDYPTPSIEKAVKGNRKIGLGVMGLADMLFYLGIPYNSEEALKIAEEVMDFVNIEAKKASIKLAEEKGNFINISQSVFDSQLRNASITVIAPTGSLSIIAETTGGIEPAYGIVFVRSNILGGKTFFEVNKAFEDIGKKEGWFTPELVVKLSKTDLKNVDEVPEKWKKVFVTALEITPEWHVKMQSAFQKHTTSSISKTVNLPSNATVEDVEKIIKMAYDLNLKGITVFRDGSRSEQVLSKPLCIECEEGACTINN